MKTSENIHSLKIARQETLDKSDFSYLQIRQTSRNRCLVEELMFRNHFDFQQIRFKLFKDQADI